jgi:hypothetical protein
MQRDAVFLQEAVDLVPGREVEESADLRFRQPAAAIPLQRQALKSCTGKIVSVATQLIGDILRKFERELRRYSWVNLKGFRRMPGRG